MNWLSTSSTVVSTRPNGTAQVRRAMGFGESTTLEEGGGRERYDCLRPFHEDVSNIAKRENHEDEFETDQEPREGPLLGLDSGASKHPHSCRDRALS